MILSPCASYVMLEDNRKSEGYAIRRQCKYHLCRVEIPTMASANNNMYGVCQNIQEICLMLKMCLFPQIDHMVMYLLIQAGTNDN